MDILLRMFLRVSEHGADGFSGIRIPVRDTGWHELAHFCVVHLQPSFTYVTISLTQSHWQNIKKKYSPRNDI